MQIRMKTPTNRAIIAARRCESMYAQATGIVSRNDTQRIQREHLKSKLPMRRTNRAFIGIVAECSPRLSSDARSLPGRPR
jgi:hypothetical protein